MKCYEQLRYVAVVAFMTACTIQPTTTMTQDRQILAPSGKLKVGMYIGSPSSMLPGPTPRDAEGVGYDLGRALAEQLGAPFEPVIFPSNDQVLVALKAGQVDVTFTNATPERAADIDFSETYMDVEKSFLVPPKSTIHSYADVDRWEPRIGVSAGSSTAEELRPLFPHALLIDVPTLARARQMLASGQLDAFATNDAILFQLSDGVPGSHVLPGHWGMEHFGVGIPKGRQQALPFINAFIRDAKANGAVRSAVNRARLRGASLSPGE